MQRTISDLGLCLRLGLRNNVRHRRKTMFPVLLTSIGMTACIVLWGFVGSSLDLTADAFTRWGARGHLVVERPLVDGSQEDEPKKLLGPEDQAIVKQVLAADPRVEVAARVLEISGTISAARANVVFAGIGVDVPEIRAIKGPEYEYDVVAGSPLWAPGPSERLILGQELARTLGCVVPNAGFRPLRPGESPETRAFSCPGATAFVLTAATVSGQLGAATLSPTGIMDWGIREVNERLVVVPLAEAQALLDTTAVSKFHVKLRDAGTIESVKADLERQFRARGLDVTVFRWSDRAVFYQQVRGLLLGFLAFVISIAVLVSLATLANTAYMTVMSRVREYGTLRSFGFSKRFVVMLCGIESAQLGTAAAIAGLLCSVAVIASVNMANLSWVPPGSSNAVAIQLKWSVAACEIAMVAAVVLSALAALAPARALVAKRIHASLSEL